jgi:hypothetical protein
MDRCAMRSQIVKRSFVIAGQKKSISFEEAVWRSLKEIATNRDVTLLDLQVPELLKTWRGIIFDHPHLRAYDEDPKTHEVDADYAKAVGQTLRPVGDRYGARSACGIIGPRRTKPTMGTRSAISERATSLRSAHQSSFR